jgi:hypothetical protein
MRSCDIPYHICELYVDDEASRVEAGLFHKVKFALHNRDLSALTNCVNLLDPDYHGRDDFRFAYQVKAFFSKNADLSDHKVCREKAEFDFIENELSCLLTNNRVQESCEVLVRDPRILSMQTYLARVLGDRSEYLAALPELIRFTSGASATHSRRESLPHLKLTPKMSVTPKSRQILARLAEFFGFPSKHFVTLGLNRVEFVPKSWKTFRSIACEPTGNLILQLTLDTWLKERLRRVTGVDLRSQARNRELARLGSVDGSYSTLDLASASDTVAKDVVRLLLPEEWFNVFDCYRTPCYINPVTGRVRVYEKFSSMGNGSTFVLETLIFAAAVHAVGVSKPCVYGDDIVVPTGKVAPLVELLTLLGFAVNTEKSFSTGFFRESCGRHYFRGVEVTPFYLRQWSMRKASIRYHNINGLGSIVTGRNLEGFVLSLIRKNDLLVPFNGMSTSGIWIHISDAYERKLFRCRNGIIEYRILFSSSWAKRVSTLQTYYLWFFRKNFLKSQRVGLLHDDCVQSSGVQTLKSSYRRGFVCWIPPAQATPDHLYWWSDLILSKSKVQKSLDS